MQTQPRLHPALAHKQSRATPGPRKRPVHALQAELAEPIQVKTTRDSTISMRVIRSMVMALEQTGTQRTTFLATAGITNDALESTEARVSRGEAYRLAALAVDSSADPAFGLHWAERLRESSYAPVSNLIVHSLSLRDGLAQLRRFARLISDDVRYDILEDTATLTIRTVPLCDEPLPLFRFLSEMTLTGFLGQVRRFNALATPLRVDFEYPAPTYSSEYARVFGGRQQFEQAHTQIVFDAGLLNERYILRDGTLHTALESLAERSLLRMNHALPWALRARDVLIRKAWPERMDMEDVAFELGLSVRSLRRRLTQEGTTFADVSNDAMRIVAKQLLRNPIMSIDAISDAMGFSDKSTFYRAFKRWTGMTPNGYRATAYSL